jgi:hypothetical protein
MTAQIDSLHSYLVAALTRLSIYLRDSWPGVLTGVGVVRTRARLGPDTQRHDDQSIQDRVKQVQFDNKIESFENVDSSACECQTCLTEVASESASVEIN